MVCPKINFLNQPKSTERTSSPRPMPSLGTLYSSRKWPVSSPYFFGSDLPFVSLGMESNPQKIDPTIHLTCILVLSWHWSCSSQGASLTCKPQRPPLSWMTLKVSSLLPLKSLEMVTRNLLKLRMLLSVISFTLLPVNLSQPILFFWPAKRWRSTMLLSPENLMIFWELLNKKEDARPLTFSKLEMLPSLELNALKVQDLVLLSVSVIVPSLDLLLPFPNQLRRRRLLFPLKLRDSSCSSPLSLSFSVLLSSVSLGPSITLWLQISFLLLVSSSQMYQKDFCALLLCHLLSLLNVWPKKPFLSRIWNLSKPLVQPLASAQTRPEHWPKTRWPFPVCILTDRLLIVQ